MKHFPKDYSCYPAGWYRTMEGWKVFLAGLPITPEHARFLAILSIPRR